ncbi:calcium uptake protein, mitochondrial-like [Vitis vinifera]|uniref:calcium uptake protein, mitochondrial-like n=1 Tax=Vitis vinifera TaxID=29760 RepID=UPI00015C8984|nr:calcium uptake protein, mitochondrial-like [Vitis vinifera]
MALMRAHNRQGSLHRDGLRFGFRTVGSVENGGLLEHFFGKDGKAKLQHEKFFQFMRDLHDELLILEFAHYDYKLRGSISAKDFALSMVASADLSHLNRLLDRVDGLNKQSSLSDIRITFEEFKSFAELRRRLRPFALALSSYGKVNGLLTKTDFQRAASNVCGISLSKCVVEIIFHVFDMNDDGNLSSEELVRVLQKRERDIAQPMESGIMGFFSCCCNHSNYGSISGLLS